MKRLGKLSLRVRLTLLFLLLTSAAWGMASFVAWQQTTDKLDKLFDTQQLLFARRLSAMNFDELHTLAPQVRTKKKVKHGHLDDDALAFAIFTTDGKMVLNDGENGQDILWGNDREGFSDGYLRGDDDEWRFLWLTTRDGRHRIVVGQEWDYRREMALDIVTSQLTPWLVALPLMFLLLIVLSFYIDQFNNEANPLAHATTTAPEIFQQLEGDIDAIVVGVGSGGTLGGLQAWFAEHSPKTEFILADPAGSILADQVETGRYGETGSWLVEGIGEDFIPPLAHLEGVRSAYRVTDSEAFATARQLLQVEGILAGSSTGTLLTAALRYCRSQTSPKRVVTFACDSGNKYLSKMFNDDWMRQQGFLSRPSRGDLSDFIALRHDEGATVTAAPDDTLAAILARMRLYDISQLPVLENGRVVGIVDEWDLISHVQGDSQRFALPVREAMTRNVETLDKHAPESALKAIFDRGLVAVIADNDRFLGLITRSDVLTTWRNRLEQ
ncbi:pyridoxal-phosphate dependent enzyme [Klebsiella grimontii]